MLIHVLETALPVFFVLFLGVLCRRKRLISRDGVNALKNAAVNITLPAVLFSAFVKADYTPKKMLIPVMMFFLCVFALVIGHIVKKLLKIKSGLFPYLMTGFEAGMLGYGLLELLYPGQSNSGFALVDLGQVLFVFTLYKALLAGKGNIKAIIKEAVTSPVLWAIITGLVLGISGIYKRLEPSGVAGIIDALTDFVSAPTGVLILISIGYDLTFKDLPWKAVMINTLARVIVMAIVGSAAFMIDKFLLGSIIETPALVMMLILPAPYVLPVFTDAENERAEISSTLSIMTLLSMILFAIMAVVM